MDLDLTRLHQRLIDKNLTIAAAESCSGGLVSFLSTSLSGSSRYFLLGVVAYSNAAKIKILKVPAALIAECGAVSDPVARHMAVSVRRIARSDFGIGITGIAGPAGATTAKPVGTVYIAVSSKKGCASRRFQFKGSRTEIRKRAARYALAMLARKILP